MVFLLSRRNTLHPLLCITFIQKQFKLQYIKEMACTLPAFADDVRVWLAQLESYFVANNVTEQRQLHLLFSAFPAPLMPVVKDLITDTPLIPLMTVSSGGFCSGRHYQRKNVFKRWSTTSFWGTACQANCSAEWGSWQKMSLPIVPL